MKRDKWFLFVEQRKITLSDILEKIQFVSDFSLLKIKPEATNKIYLK
jgi:hypothetical protein